MDMIEDREAEPDQEASEEIVAAVLKDFGSPREVTQLYGAHNYLIGPRLYPIYLQVLRIVLIVVAALNVLGLIIAVITPQRLTLDYLRASLRSWVGCSAVSSPPLGL
jgi:hypothetical protein